MTIIVDLFDVIAICILGASLLVCGIVLVIENIKQRRKNRK